jgi:hypothetical protein
VFKKGPGVSKPGQGHSRLAVGGWLKNKIRPVFFNRPDNKEE